MSKLTVDYQNLLNFLNEKYGPAITKSIVDKNDYMHGYANALGDVFIFILNNKYEV